MSLFIKGDIIVSRLNHTMALEIKYIAKDRYHFVKRDGHKSAIQIFDAPVYKINHNFKLKTATGYFKIV